MQAKNSISIVRHAVFETNSSSCHSLALAKSENGGNSLSKLYTDFNLDENGNLHFDVDCYGWGFEVLSNFQTKLAYVMTYVISLGSYYTFLDVMETLHDVTQFNQLYWQDQLVGYWNDEENKFKFSGIYSDLDDLANDINDNTAYIDANSWGLLDSVIENEDKLKNLLFVPDSEIVIENDNHCFQVAGGNEKEVQKQIKNLLLLTLPKSKHSTVLDNDKVVNQFIKVFGRIGLSRMMENLSFSEQLDDVHNIKKTLNDVYDCWFSHKDDVGNLYDLFDLVNTLFGSRYKRFNTVRKAVCFNDMISCLDQLYSIPEFMEYVFEDFKNKVFELSTGQKLYYSELDKKISKLSISNEQTLNDMTDEQKECFEQFISKTESNPIGLENFAKHYLVRYLLLDKLKDVPLNKWTEQFSYIYHR